jgi:hypothetical protein
LFIKDAQVCGWKIKGVENINARSIYIQIYGDCIGEEQYYKCARRFYIPPACVTFFDAKQPNLEDLPCYISSNLCNCDIDFITSVIGYWENLEEIIDSSIRFPNEENNIKFGCINLDYNGTPKQFPDGSVEQVLNNNKPLAIALSEYTYFKFEADRHMLKLSI